MRKKNDRAIQVVTKYFYPVTGGIEIGIYQILSALAKNGWNIELHTSKDNLTSKNVYKNRETVNNINVLRYKTNWLGFFPRINWSSNFIFLHNCNIFPHTFLYVYVLAMKLLSKKYFVFIVKPHGGFTPEWSEFKGISKVIKRMHHSFIGRYLINTTADHVIAISDWEKEELIREGINKKIISVIGNGLENEAFSDVEKMASKNIKDKVHYLKNYFVQMGRIKAIKNFETPIRALTLLPKKYNFVILGGVQDQSYFKYLQEIANKLGVKDRVHFMGIVTGVDKYYVLKNAKAMVHMAIWESFCNALFEGMSQGNICIVGNKTASPYTVKNGVNGFCLKPYDYKGLSKKVQYVLNTKNKAQIELIKDTNIKQSKSRSWKRVAHEFEHLLINNRNI